ncbi:MAG: NAD-dependent epimerase/dehydratase family protein [Acidimicrobiales bacterium]
MRVLVVGGTGPTGPHVVRGLLVRGHDVAILHRGVHEPADLPEVEHIHGDPHFRESIDQVLASRTFDIVIAMYGRVKLLAAALAGRCDQFVSISGVPVYRGYFPRTGTQLPIPVTEAHPVVDDVGDDPAVRFSHLLAEAEAAAAAHHRCATIFRFPMIYGPNNARLHEWSIVRRVRDGRAQMILPDGGFQIHSRCAARNAAAFVLAAVDRPEVAAGQVYNCGDPYSWSLRQWADAIVGLLGAELEMIPVPAVIATEAATALLPLANTTATHCVLSTEKAQHELGYRPVVEPMEALEEVLAWYESRPDVDPHANPSFTDRFDYETEDALIAAYRAAVGRISDEIEQHPAPAVHSMPHPRSPGAVDHRGR